MSVSKEIRIGLLVTIATFVLFAGFYFLKGANLFSSEKEYYCFYNDVEGLQTSATVQIHGLNVGRVSRTELVGGRGVRIAIALSKKIDLPEGTIASLASGDLLGNKIIRLDLGKGPGMIQSGDTLTTATEVGLIDNISSQVSPILKQVNTVIGVLDTALLGVNSLLSAQNQQNLTNTIASLHGAVDNFNQLSKTLNSESGEITSVIHSANKVATNLSNNNDNISHILTNLNTTSDQLAKSDIQGTFKDLKTATDNLQGILNKVNSDQGSIGLLINNKDAYNNLTNTLASLNTLLADLKAHPSHYVNISIFGKKKD